MTRVLTDTVAQALIDKEVVILDATIRAMKTRRNTHSAITHLHDDILSLVFTEVRASAPNAWFHVNQICTHWRAVALNTPQIWTTINLTHKLDHARTMLQRAKSVPLDVECFMPYTKADAEAFWPLVAKIMSSECSIRSLDLTASKFELLTRFINTNPSYIDTSNLEDIRIRGPEDSLLLRSLGKWHQFPKLKSLHLCFLPIPATLPFLPHLTHVTLIGRHVSAPSVMYALQRMPAIEDVSIRLISGENTSPTVPIRIQPPQAEPSQA